MPDNIEELRAKVRDTISQAELALGEYLAALARKEIGFNLGQHIMTMPVGLDKSQVAVFIKMPDQTEIALRFTRQAGLDWVCHPWSSRGGYGKFAAVRYEIVQEGDKFHVKQRSTHEWFATEDEEAACIVAANYFREREELYQEVARKTTEYREQLRSTDVERLTRRRS
jgi:hypothetical protein